MAGADVLVMHKRFVYDRSMESLPNVANIAALIADPARAAILNALLDGRAWTATELSIEAGVTPQTTSGHLAKLLDGAMVAVARQGRHRYYRLANSKIAHVLETLAVAAGGTTEPRGSKRAEAARLRDARTCYDHLAGRLAVRLVHSMIDGGYLETTAEDFTVSARGDAFLAGLGIDLAAVRKARRAFARQCLDWSEREPHLGGALGKALAVQMFDEGWLKRVPRSRRVIVTAAGESALETHFPISRDRTQAVA